jgi:hypothetical protein
VDISITIIIIIINIIIIIIIVIIIIIIIKLLAKLKQKIPKLNLLPNGLLLLTLTCRVIGLVPATSVPNLHQANTTLNNNKANVKNHPKQTKGKKQHVCMCVCAYVHSLQYTLSLLAICMR